MQNEVNLNVNIITRIVKSYLPPDDQPEVLPVDCQLDIEFQHTEGVQSLSTSESRATVTSSRFEDTVPLMIQ